MKEIGEKLKARREDIGVTIDEAAEDLKLRPSQIEHIEEGNIEAFKDIFYLKYFIRDYSKYLGLNYEDLVDEFNEFLFDYTSRISLEEIKKAKKEEVKETRKIISPYTLERKKKFTIHPYVIYSFIGILIILIVYLITTYYNQDKKPLEENVISYNTVYGGVV